MIMSPLSLLSADNLNGPVIITVIAMGVMQMPAYRIVYLVTVRDFLVATVRAVHVIGSMS